MNILIVSHQGGMAGSTYSIFYLARGLLARGHHVWVGCLPGSLMWQLLAETDVALVPLAMRSKVDRKSIRQIAHLVRQHRIDIINAQSSRDRYLTILAKWHYRLSCKLVHTRRQLSRSVGVLGQSWFYERGTDKIIAVSEGVKQSLVDIGIRAKHIYVIHNGIPPEKFAAADTTAVARLKKQYGIEEGDIVIGSVSRLKEQDQILQALRHVSQKVKVILVGIEKRADYEKIIQHFTTPHEVYFTGPVSNQEALQYYPLLRMNILASVIEGLSQALLEAMAAGIPVIATRVGGNPELIRHGENGLLFDNEDIPTLANLISQLIGDDVLHTKLSANGRKTAREDFSIETTLDRYEHFFLELLKQPS